MPTIGRPFLAVLVIVAAITTTKGTVEITYPPYLAGYGYTLTLIGFLTSLIAVLQLVSRLPVGAAYRAELVRRQFALALAAFAISTSGFAFAAGEPLAVAALSVLHGFAFGSPRDARACAGDRLRRKSSGRSLDGLVHARELDWGSRAEDERRGEGEG